MIGRNNSKLKSDCTPDLVEGVLALAASMIGYLSIRRQSKRIEGITLKVEREG